MMADCQQTAIACRRVVDFLTGRQRADGSWADWALPPGPADAWMTAYVGTRLAELNANAQQAHCPAVLNAAQWVQDHTHRDGGWSYNSFVDVDADSTAWAHLLLRAAGLHTGRSARDDLARFQQPDGGFATFPATAGLGTWGSSHPDVTAVALAVLAAEPSAGHMREAACSYLQRQRRTDGLWNAYWWATPLYTTALCLPWLVMIDPVANLPAVCEQLLEITPQGSFETALLLECLVHVNRTWDCDRGPRAIDDRIRGLLAALLGQQLPDGSWPSMPSLRLTDRTCATPWLRSDCGTLYADTERLFTSATVLRALNTVRLHLPLGAR